MLSEASVTYERFVSCLSKSEMKHWLLPSELRRVIVKSHDDVLSSMKRAYDKPADGKAFFFKKAPIKAPAAKTPSKKQSENEGAQDVQGDNAASTTSHADVVVADKKVDVPEVQVVELANKQELEESKQKQEASEQKHVESVPKQEIGEQLAIVEASDKAS
mmetsp:Transcript_9635/g.18791  ORF Transcript_9635/g.18791 Transcript_9635/m.18791 type:complete len:161 (+) Transcript_9635:568-1050(+)